MNGIGVEIIQCADVIRKAIQEVVARYAWLGAALIAGAQMLMPG